MKKILLVCLLAILFIGCGRTPVPGIPIQTKIYHDKDKSTGINIIKVPNIDTIKTAEVGDNLYVKYNQNLKNTYLVSSERGAKATLSNGDTINTFNSTKKALSIENLFKWNDDKNAVCYPIYIHNIPNISICLVDIENKGYFSVAAYNNRDKTYPLSNSVNYKLISTPASISEDSFKYVALYQGKTNNKIKLTFREFYKNMYRAAFSQEIEYDLNPKGSTIIGFKGLRIEVLKATNLDITYKVIKDYN